MILIFLNNNGNTLTSWPATEQYISHGGSSDLWGLTWTVAQINASDFGVSIKAEGIDPSGGDGTIDAVRITVYYTATPARSPLLYYEDSWNYTFTEPNTHKYIDAIYKTQMMGTITVTE